MEGILIIIAVAFFATWYYPSSDKSIQLPDKLANNLDRLWSITQVSIRENKYLRAEKALLTILNIDNRNATAYNRLGILYAKQHNYEDAIECFEIAQSLEPNASSLHNVGLIYYETGDYQKSALAFEQAMELESNVASRYIAYAKTQEKLNNSKKMIESLEQAVKLEPVPQILQILAEAYDNDGQVELAAKLRKKVLDMLSAAETTRRTPKKLKQPRKLVM